MHGDLSPPEALSRVVEQVRDLRRSGAEPHPLNRWARERWLRHTVVVDPSPTAEDEALAQAFRTAFDEVRRWLRAYAPEAESADPADPAEGATRSTAAP